MGQAPDSAHSHGQVTAGLPSSLVALGFPATHPIDWQQFRLPEDCGVVFQQSGAVQLTRACLERFRVADIPPFALPMARELAIQINADSLMQAIVARQLAPMPATAVAVRAALLDSVVKELMGATGRFQSRHWTPAHIQLARTFQAQLDALGPMAIDQQLDTRGIMMGPAIDAHDLDAQIAIFHDKIRLLQQPEVATKLGITNYKMDLKVIDEELSRLEYFQTMSFDTLASYAAKLNALYGRDITEMLNVPAPSLNCDYYFPTQQGNTPQVGPKSLFPPQGQLSLIVFGNGKFGQAIHLHQAMPKVPITIVTHTTGFFAGHFLVAQPEQEAMLRHRYVVDSLGIPGAFCVTTTHYHLTAEGHAIPSSDPNLEAYHLPLNEMVIAISPSGKTLNAESVDLVNGEEMEWYLKRLEEKFEKESHKSGQP
jgi:hypothetical protein